MKVAVNRPLLVVSGKGVVVTGVVVTGVLPKSMVTVEAGANPAPLTVTEVPLGPEDGSRIITRSIKAVT